MTRIYSDYWVRDNLKQKLAFWLIDDAALVVYEVYGHKVYYASLAEEQLHVTIKEMVVRSQVGTSW